MLAALLCAALAASPESARTLVGKWLTDDGYTFHVVEKEGDVWFDQDGIGGRVQDVSARPPPAESGVEAGWVVQLADKKGVVWLSQLGADELESVFTGQGTVHRMKAKRDGGGGVRPPSTPKPAPATTDPFIGGLARRADVVALPSGLHYSVVTEGTGRSHPGEGCSCTFHYESRTAADYEADKGPYDATGSLGRPPVTFKVGLRGLLPGLNEALQLMVQGDVWDLYIPPELSYSDYLGGYHHPQHPQAPGWVYRSNTPLVMRVSLVSIGDEALVPSTRCDPKERSGCSDKELEYVAKQMAAQPSSRSKDLRRLLGVLTTSSLAGAQRDWAQRRVALLRRLGVQPSEEERASCETGECPDSAGKDEL